jgi:phage tail tube protein FII
MAFKIPAGLGSVLGDAIHKAIFKDPVIFKGVIEPKSDSQVEYDPNSPNTAIELMNDQAVFGLRSVYSKIRTEGVSKNNQFLVLLDTIPAGINGMGATTDGLKYDYMNPYSDSSFFSSSVESVVFPGMSYLTTEYRKYGMMLKVPFLRDYQEVTIVFRCNASMWERKFFDSWAGLVSNNLSLDFKFKDDYVTGITVTQLDAAFKRIYTQTIFNAYPIRVSDMEASYENDNVYQRIAVTFAYDFVQQRNDGDDVQTADPGDYENNSEATPTPDFPGSRNTIRGSKGISPIERVMREILKVETNKINNKIIKRVPVGNIPGFGTLGGL